MYFCTAGPEWTVYYGTGKNAEKGDLCNPMRVAVSPMRIFVK